MKKKKKNLFRARGYMEHSTKVLRERERGEEREEREGDRQGNSCVY